MTYFILIIILNDISDAIKNNIRVPYYYTYNISSRSKILSANAYFRVVQKCPFLFQIYIYIYNIRITSCKSYINLPPLKCRVGILLHTRLPFARFGQVYHLADSHNKLNFLPSGGERKNTKNINLHIIIYGSNKGVYKVNGPERCTYEKKAYSTR